MDRRALRGVLGPTLGAALAASALWLALSRGTSLGSPSEGVSALLYRVAFLLALPALTALRAAGVEVDDRSPSWVLATASLATTVAAAALLGLAARARRRRRERREERAVGPADPGRRAVVERVVAGTAGAAILGVSGYAVAVEPTRLRVAELEVPIDGLPPWADGLRLLHVSDTHYGPFVSLDYLEEVVRRGNALAPDLIALTGDYVHWTARAIEPGIRVLAGLTARHGVVAVLGNHDHWAGAERCRAALRRGGALLLDNRCLHLGPEGWSELPGRGDSLCVAGVGDFWEDEHEPGPVLRAVPPAEPRLLLSHNPDVAELLTADTRVDLLLAGHTHGGQVALPGRGPLVTPSAYGARYAGGLCQGPVCPVLVSRGVGMAILPVRLGVRPEIGLVTLRRDGSGSGGVARR